jgi:hypothetical protein
MALHAGSRTTHASYITSAYPHGLPHSPSVSPAPHVEGGERGAELSRRGWRYRYQELVGDAYVNQRGMYTIGRVLNLIKVRMGYVVLSGFRQACSGS